MDPKYHIGQKVIIKPPVSQSPNPRDSTLDKYAGQIGTIIDYHWISPRLSEVFYIYSVKMEANDNEIVVHEDEIEKRPNLSLKNS